MRTRVEAWLRAHPLLFDATLTAALCLLLLIELDALLGTGLVQAALALPMLVLITVPTVLRRRSPILSFALIMLGGLGQLTVLSRPSPVDVAVPLAIYSVAAYGRQSWVRPLALAVGLLGAVAGAARWSTTSAELGPFVANALFLMTLVALAWVTGYYRRTRRLYIEGLEERASRLELEREQRETLAAQRERARIAREMHDVVAHSLSIVVLQADGAAYAAERHPEAAVQALTTIGETGRQALTEMRRLLGVLRDDETASLRPQPGLADAESLVQTLRAAGHPTSLTITGEPAGTSAGLAMAAYRILQECATNVLKHAGDRARVEVSVAYRPGAVELAVLDDGRGAAALPTGSGNGLRGMRERAALFGGSVVAGPRPGGGFAVRVVLPVDNATPPVGGPTPDPPDERAAAGTGATPTAATTRRLSHGGGAVPPTEPLPVGRWSGPDQGASTWPLSGPS